MRDKTFNMRMSAEEWQRFEAIARHYEMPVASMIRLLVRREADWLAAPKGFAHAIHQRDRRALIVKERERLDAQPDTVPAPKRAAKVRRRPRAS